MPDRPAVEAQGLVKQYDTTRALDGVDLDVPAGSVTAVLGPNGAGKTTAVRVLTTLTTPDGGQARVAGHDVITDPHEVRRRIGLAAQDATVDPLLTGRENLVMLGELHQLRRREARDRAAAMLIQFDLDDAAERRVGGYSGGMRRRLDLAATLVARPEVLFLDEPTTGLDPRARSEMWTVIETLVDEGTTVLLTTQYLDEADRLSDDIVVIDHGRVIARGDARSLKREIGGDHLQVIVARADTVDPAAAVVRSTTGIEPSVDRDSRTLTVATSEGVTALARLADALSGADIEVEDLGLRQPTLDEVFLTLTGAPPEDAVDAEAAT
jgi:ABC-2 type transport system ATP-binding protein